MSEVGLPPISTTSVLSSRTKDAIDGHKKEIEDARLALKDAKAGESTYLIKGDKSSGSLIALGDGRFIYNTGTGKNGELISSFLVEKDGSIKTEFDAVAPVARDEQTIVDQLGLYDTGRKTETGKTIYRREHYDKDKSNGRGEYTIEENTHGGTFYLKFLSGKHKTAGEIDSQYYEKGVWTLNKAQDLASSKKQDDFVGVDLPAPQAQVQQVKPPPITVKLVPPPPPVGQRGDEQKQVTLGFGIVEQSNTKQKPVDPLPGFGVAAIKEQKVEATQLPSIPDGGKVKAGQEIRIPLKAQGLNNQEKMFAGFMFNTKEITIGRGYLMNYDWEKGPDAWFKEHKEDTIEFKYDKKTGELVITPKVDGELNLHYAKVRELDMSPNGPDYKPVVSRFSNEDLEPFKDGGKKLLGYARIGVRPEKGFDDRPLAVEKVTYQVGTPLVESSARTNFKSLDEIKDDYYIPRLKMLSLAFYMTEILKKTEKDDPKRKDLEEILKISSELAMTSPVKKNDTETIKDVEAKIKKLKQLLNDNKKYLEDEKIKKLVTTFYEDSHVFFDRPGNYERTLDQLRA